MSNSGNYKETQDVWSFQTDLFQKLPIIIKLRVHSDASVLIKCWFYKQALQKVLIELSPGVLVLPHYSDWFCTGRSSDNELKAKV